MYSFLLNLALCISTKTHPQLVCGITAPYKGPVIFTVHVVLNTGRINRVVERQSGSIFFTGATASLRGGSGFAAFASAKFALRALSQSMARELGPQGIHVAHFIIDGAIDTAFIKETFPDTYALKEKDGILSPESIADSYWFVHSQHRSAWTHELDLRPYMEKF